MRGHGFTRVVLASVLLVGLVGCTRTGDEFMITNELDVPVLHWLGMEPDQPPELELDFDSGIKPGASIEIHLTYEDLDFPWDTWPFSHWAPASCREDLYLFIKAEDGRKFVHEPPLCDDGRWVISD